MKFRNIYEKIFKKSLIKVDNIFDCELLWLKDNPYSDIIYESYVHQWKKSFNLFTDNQVVICSRLPDIENSNLIKDIQFYLVIFWGNYR